MAGAVNRDFWTCGSLSEIGGSLERKAPGCAMCLDVQISWQAQYFVDLQMQISWWDTLFGVSCRDNF